MQRNMLPTATTLHFISYLCSQTRRLSFIYLLHDGKRNKNAVSCTSEFHAHKPLGQPFDCRIRRRTHRVWVGLRQNPVGISGDLRPHHLPILFPWRRNRLEIIHREALAQHGWPPTFRRQRARFGLLSDRHRLQRQHVMHHFHTHLLRSRRPILCARPVTLLLCFQEIV